MSWDLESFREKIESQHQFPGKYTFKFIVPIGKKEQVTELLKNTEITYRNSSGNKYVSLTALAHLDSSQEVLDIYLKANEIEGCIAL